MSGGSDVHTSGASGTGTVRRGFLRKLIGGTMVAALMASYGTFVAYAARFLFPTGRGGQIWQFVSTLEALPAGNALNFQTPSGAKIVIARQTDEDSADSFIALSSICPHLGCAVHWEQVNQRFFCPCHNGAFDRTGKAIQGPPAAANQQLTRYPLKVEKGLLYVQVSTETVSTDRREA